VLGQIVHNGDWDPTPHGLPNLLKNIDQSTTLNVQFKRAAIDPESGDVFAFPILYMTGQRKFAFSEQSRKRLREYLDNGGTMVVDNTVGGTEFDVAFREEIKKLYPDRALKPLEIDHPLFTFVNDVRQVSLAPLAAQLMPGIETPRIEAIEVEGTLPVIYSPLSMSAGWEQLPRAYNKGYSDQDALRLGTNVFMYVVTH